MDGVTLLSGSNYVAQLYAGPTVERLRPVSAPTPFQSGLNAGYFYPQTVRIPTVGPGSNAIVQVRVWEWPKGSTYEEARAFGGKFGKSDLLTVTLGSAEMPPTCLTGLRAFRLEAGRPEFAAGRISSVERRSDGRLVLAHEGEVGFRYLIEKSDAEFEWRPYMVITNDARVVTFTDQIEPNAAAFYRSRILD